MTPVKNQKGFTIIEVILFLAITGLVLVIGFAGIGGRSAAVQHTDSIRSLDAFLQSQLNEVFNGVNRFGSGESETDVLLGKFILFPDDETVDVVSMTGTRLSEEDILDRKDETYPDRWLVYDSSPRSVGATSYKLDWGTKFHSANVGANNLTANGVAIMRSPNSTRIFPIAWDFAAGLESNIDNKNLYEPDTSGGFGYLLSPEVYFCLQGANGKYATISYAAGDRQNAFETYFDPEYSPDKGNSSCGPTL
ncbi:MAG: prepilin-type N-terminal cleavage/methylation domain-containing protein [Candidatus Saccharimonadales bacterium]|nr:prepilin-type N-terminal cleavage/methylation domain-containing protein [Candidatus Saccharimonadales bacterium]